MCIWAFVLFVIVVVVIPWLAVRAYDNRPSRGFGTYTGIGSAHYREITGRDWAERAYDAATLAEQRRTGRHTGWDASVRIPRNYADYRDHDLTDHIDWLADNGADNGVYIEWY